MTVLEHLRQATRPAHERLETRLDIFNRLRDIPARRALLARFLGFYRPQESALAPYLDAVPGFDFARRRKSDILRHDLQTLGLDRDSIAALPCDFPVTLQDEAEAFGLCYVMEGATLGGAVITKQLEKHGIAATGLTFFHSYGKDTGEMWRQFCARLEERCAGPAAARTIRGAVHGFTAIEAWLVAGSPAEDIPHAAHT